MKTRIAFGIFSASVLLSLAGSSAEAGWYLGEHHDLTFQSRFLQRPCPPYHGRNRPFYGWSSNYRPYYFTPQSYANTPWNYGPGYQESLMHTAAPPLDLNAYPVPVTNTTTPVAPTLAAPTPAPTPAPPAAMMPKAPTIPEPPNPGIK